MPPKSKKTQISDIFLLIVESPSKCAKIESYLGDRYQCISSKGHIREIDGLSSIDTKDKFQIEYTIIKDKKDHVENMRKTVAKYSPLNILLATDDDREGEAIAWHICQVCALDPILTKRIVFHEITQPALVAAVNAPTRINLSLVAAQQARQVLDMVVGFKISPLLWRNLGSNRKNALSAGRCQTPALRLVHDHHQKYTELRSGGITQIYKVSGIFTNRCIKFDLDTDITSQQSLLEFLEKSKTHEHRLTIGKTRQSTRSPPKPFNTSRLLQVASNICRLSPKQTMNHCQTLYQSGLITYMRTECQKYSDVFLKKSSEYIKSEYGEAYIGDLDSIKLVDTTMPHEGIRVTNLSLTSMTSNDAGLSRLYGLIWRNTVESCMAIAKYNMTDYSVSSPSVSDMCLDSAKYKYTMETPIFLGWRRVEIKDAGTLTETQATESSLSLYLRLCAFKSPPTEDEMNEQCAADCALTTRNFAEHIAKSPTPLTWSLIESKVTIDSRLDETPDCLCEAKRPEGVRRDAGEKTKESRRSLPHHYTEASLIQKLEDFGIGRPSTFSSIVETIQERGYVKKTDVKGIVKKCTEYKLRPSSSSQHTYCVIEKTESEKSFGDEKDKLVIQPTGILVLEFLLQHFDDCFSYDYTKSMETELDIISSRTSEEALATWHTICRKCFDDITEKSKPLAKQTKQTFTLSDTADHVLVFNTYGASIKSLSDKQYSKIRPEVELDLEKAKRGEYTMAELIWREDNGCLGEYQGSPVYLKKGKFGLYAEYATGKEKSKDKNTISLKPLNKAANEIVLEDVVRLIEQKSNVISEEDAAVMFLPQSVFNTDGGMSELSVIKSGYGQEAKSNVRITPDAKRQRSKELEDSLSEAKEKTHRVFVGRMELSPLAPSGGTGSNKTLLRQLRPDLSIRKGKYGPYIFHQTTKMSKPAFHPIKPLKDKWESMANLELITAIENTYRLSI
jgi:DNA topoisomerase IA